MKTKRKDNRFRILTFLLLLMTGMQLAAGCAWMPESIQSNLADRLAAQARRDITNSDLEAARAGLATAIELEPDNPELYTLRGQVYLNVYEWDKSLADFNTAIELAPEYADAYFQRGVLYYSILQTGQELRQEALADFQHYLDLAPEGQYADQAREYSAKIEAELAAMAE